MAFTDDDLAQMKRELNRKIENIAVWAPALQAMIARLEAAEALIGKHPLYVKWISLYAAWKRAAGK